jgi:hypothetical protein
MGVQVHRVLLIGLGAWWVVWPRTDVGRVPSSERLQHTRVAETWPGIAKLDIDDLELLLESIA